MPEIKTIISRERRKLRKILKGLYGKQIDSLITHHIDGNPLNNHFDNLIVLTRRQHYKVHVLAGGYKSYKNKNRRKHTLKTLDSLLIIYNTL